MMLLFGVGDVLQSLSSFLNSNHVVNDLFIDLMDIFELTPIIIQVSKIFKDSIVSPEVGLSDFKKGHWIYVQIDTLYRLYKLDFRGMCRGVVE